MKIDELPQDRPSAAACEPILICGYDLNLSFRSNVRRANQHLDRQTVTSNII